MPAGCLAGLEVLSTLRIGGCGLGRIPSEVLLLRSLRTLDLNTNGISEVRC